MRLIDVGMRLIVAGITLIGRALVSRNEAIGGFRP